MPEPYSRLLQSLQKRQIPLKDYVEYLTLSLETPFKNLSQSLTESNLSLSEYLEHLEQNSSSSRKPIEFARNEDIPTMEAIGQLLLEEKRITLTELNEILRSLETLTLEKFVQQLLRFRKIQAMEFFHFIQGKFSHSTTSSYRFKRDSCEFALDFSTAQKKYGSYILIEELGRGGMGIVYKAYHPQLNRFVALKILLAGKASSEKTLQRFRREIEVLAKLKHEGIVQIYDSGSENTELYLAMEYIEGSPLNQNHHLSLQEKVHLMKHVLIALHYAHENGIVHRDLKLENILLTPEKKPKIVDFGLAKVLEDDLPSEEKPLPKKLTQSGIILGTTLYMAPEQTTGDSDKINAQTDVYTAGVCLYHLLTQQFPHEGKSLHSLLYKIAHEDPIPPSRYVPKLRHDLEKIILKALEKNKDQRYPSAQAFADDLDRFLKGYPVQALNINFQTHIYKWSHRHKKTLLGSLFVFIFLFGILITSIVLKIRERTTLFQEQYQLALQKLQITTHSNPQEVLYEHLQAWNYLNRAMQIDPRHPLAETKKWETGERLLEIALKQGNPSLGDYVIQEMQQLTLISASKRTKQMQQWDHQKNIHWQNEEKRFQHWLARFATGKFSEEQADATFEILKMTTPSISRTLLEILNEGDSFFRTQGYRQEPAKSNYFIWIVFLLSRKQIKEALPDVCKSLSTLVEQVALSKNHEDLPLIHYLVELSRYLLLLKISEKADFLYQLRVKAGVTSLFWQRTQFINKKLYQIQLTNTEKNSILQSSKAFSDRGIAKASSEDWDSAISDFTEAIRLNPNDVVAFNNRGNAKMAKKDFDGAIQDFTESIRLNPQYATAYTNRGNAKLEKNDLTSAFDDYTEAIRINPQLSVAYNNRGNVRKARKDFEGAVADYTECIRLHPQSTEAYTNRGNVKLDQKDFTGALEDLTKAILLNPQNAAAYNNRGNAKKEKKDFEGALEDFTEAIRLDSQYFFAYNNRGFVKFQKKDLDGAIADYTEAIRLNPEYGISYNNRGNAYLDKKNWDSAIADYTQAIRFNPQYLAAYNNRGNAKKEKKDLNGAILDYTEAIRINSQDPGVYWNRGSSYFQCNQKQKAKDDFKQLLSIAKNRPASPEIQKMKSLIFKWFPELKSSEENK